MASIEDLAPLVVDACELRLLIVGRFFDRALDFIHLLRLRAGGEFGQLNLNLLDRLVLLDDGLVKRLQ